MGLVLIEDETYFFYEYKQIQIYITRKRIIFNRKNKRPKKQRFLSNLQKNFYIKNYCYSTNSVINFILFYFSVLVPCNSTQFFTCLAMASFHCSNGRNFKIKNCLQAQKSKLKNSLIQSVFYFTTLTQETAEMTMIIHQTITNEYKNYLPLTRLQLQIYRNGTKIIYLYGSILTYVVLLGIIQLLPKTIEFCK